jgi:hypothetical protein
MAKHEAQRVKEPLQIVAVHGVGHPPLGSVVKELASGLVNKGPEPGVRSFTLGDHQFPTIDLRDQGLEMELYEVNWSDLKRPPRRVGPLLLFLINTLLSMVQLSQSGWRGDNKGAAGASRFGTAYRWVFLGIALFVPLVPAALLQAYVTPDPRLALASIILVALFGLALTFWLRRSDPILYAGYLWSVASLAAGLLLLNSRDRAENFIGWTTSAAIVINLVLGCCAALAMGEVIVKYFRDRKQTTEPFRTLLVRLTFFILPVVLLLGGVGSLFTATNLYLTDKLAVLRLVDGEKFTQWGKLFERHLRYNLAFLEVVNSALTLLIGSVLVLGMVIWLALTKFPLTRGTHAGPFLRHWMTGSLIFIFLAYLAGAGAQIASGLHKFPAIDNFRLCSLPYVCSWLGVVEGSRGETTPLEIYRLSATRLLPFVFLLVGPLRLSLEVAADVLFYLLPARFSLSTNRDVRQRLEILLEHLSASGKPPAVILAHSQGSKIALDVSNAAKHPPPRFISLGSPINALYAKFLNIREHANPEYKSPIGDWRNMYRWSDFVAGDVPVAGVQNVVVEHNFAQGHFGYWTEPLVMKALAEIAAGA